MQPAGGVPGGVSRGKSRLGSQPSPTWGQESCRRERQGGGSEPWHTGRGELKLKWGT